MQTVSYGLAAAAVTAGVLAFCIGVKVFCRKLIRREAIRRHRTGDSRE